jgi:hypothetical protein
MPQRSRRLSRAVERIHGEYLEMPGLSLNLPQAERLFGLDEVTCTHALRRLLRAKFLYRTERGEFIRTSL